MRDRKIFLILSITILFAFLVIVWYFFSSKPTPNPTINNPTNPFGEPTAVHPGGEFINKFINGLTNNNNSSSTVDYTPASERTIIQIWDKPTAGYNFVTREIIQDGTTTNATSTSSGTTTLVKKLSKPTKKTVEYLMFVDRMTGHIYGYNKDNGIPFQISNTTIPGIYDAYILRNGSKVFMRYFDKDNAVIKTITATIPSFIEGSDPHPLTNLRSLPGNISSFAISESSNLFSYITPNYSGSSVTMVDSKDNISTFNSPLREWYLTYGGETPYITNKPSAYLEGSTFSLPKNIYSVGGKTGLMSLSNRTGDLILSSMWTNSGLATFISSKKNKDINVLNIKTITSKCVWMNENRILCGVPSDLPKGDEGLPDDWFQGSISFSDDLFLIDTNLNLSYSILSLSQETGNTFDIIRPQTNKNSSLMLFTNKQDSSMWMVNINKAIYSPSVSQ